MALDLPTTGDKKETGEVAFEAVQLAYDQDSLYPRAVAKAVNRYLKGERNFRIFNPLDNRQVMFEIELEDGYPTHEAVVSDVTAQIGKQQRLGIGPRTKRELHTLKSARDAAVAQGLLSYHATDRVIASPNRMFQRGRVIDGVAGLALSQTVYPGFGWGFKLLNIPLRELVFLPIGCETEEVCGKAWRRWLPMSAIEGEILKLSKTFGSAIRKLPTKDSEDYSQLCVREVQYGHKVGEDEDYTGVGLFRTSITATRQTRSTRSSRFGLFTQIWISYDGQHLDRHMVLVGKFLVYDKSWPDFERPQMPMVTSPFADVGSPYGRSYAHARMAVNMRDEQVLTTLLRNFKDTDAYGLIALSSNMGLNISEMFKQGKGFKAVTYTTDANATTAQPLQIQPAPMDRVIGRALGMMQVADQKVFPDSPLDQGRSVGRVDSNAAIETIDRLGQTAQRNGAESVRAAYSQLYRAMLEQAGNRHSQGDKIPIFFLSSDLAGAIIDAEELPLSQDQSNMRNLKRRLIAMRGMGQGRDPLISVEQEGNNAGLLSPGDSQVPTLVPVPRMTIGPNVIPSPNEVTIDIESMVPKDDETIFNQLYRAVQLGLATVFELQIEAMERGIETFVGGRMVRATYKTAVLNLLSAFGDGIESGPVLIQPHIFSRQVGYWIISAFVAEPLFGLASDTVKQKMMQLLYLYSPVNQTGGQMSADEAAAQFVMQQRQQMMMGNDLQRQLPQQVA